MNRFTRNTYVAAVQTAILGILPFILVGSLVTLIGIIPGVSDAIPTMSKISDFTFGLIGLFVAFLIPYQVMEKKKLNSQKLIAGLAGLALFLMLLDPTSGKGSAITFDFGRFGATGMFVSIVGGLFVSFVMVLFAKVDFFKNNANLPSFVINWFNSLLPILVVVAAGWVFTYVLSWDVFAAILKLFSPLTSIAESFPGFVLLCFLPLFFYSFGISGWVTMPLSFPLWMTAIQENADAVAAGGSATNIFTYEVCFVGFLTFGGIGGTLPLVALMNFAKTKRIKAIGRAGAIPSIFNINEPIVFGAPIAFNPLLMIPFWINGIVVPAMTYLALDWGLAKIPDKVFQIWYMPYPISTFLVSGWRGAIVAVILMTVSCVIWYPFFRAYDAQEARKEREEEAGETVASSGETVENGKQK
ncbi:PTS sugar transporter subunit IIC [Streptomyces sp. NPDC002795]|uniref:PTS sugar transporter subunit IIC n=1 Tax=Streptomyces sp. NPDC002795 TaxID=3364665 RepID=UPI0036956F22